MKDPQETAKLLGAAIGIIITKAVTICLQAYLLTLIVPLFALSLTFGQAFLVCLFLALVLK